MKRRALTSARSIARAARAPLLRLNEAVAGNAAVLTYHRIAADSRPSPLVVTPANLAAHLSLLRSSGRIGTVDEVVGAGRRRRLGHGRRHVAITFDDGYADNLLVALPILERFDAPATVFVAAGFIDRASFWWERLASLVEARSARPIALVERLVDIHVMAPADVSHLVGRTAEDVRQAIRRSLLNRPPAEIDDILDQAQGPALDDAQGPDAPRPVRSEELVALGQHPLITIGAHTVSHPMLTRLPPDASRREMVDGATRLREIVGRPITTFAYPFGDCDVRTARIAREVGFTMAFTTKRRWLSPVDASLLLPRLHVVDVDADGLGTDLGLG